METNQEKPIIFKNFARLAFYAGIALGLFFFSAMAVFVLRNRATDTIVMPDLVGKYYINVHNDLIQSRVTVQLEHRRYPDQPHGIVLYQSIPAGSIVGVHEKLYVTVNEGDPVLNMPDLNGLSIQAAKITLNRITKGDDVFSLEIGAVSEIPVKDVPPGTVIDQFPKAGDSVMVQDRVYLLVAKEVDRNPSEGVELALKNQQISIALEWLNQRGLEYRIRTLKKPEMNQSSGRVWQVSQMEDGTVLLDAYYREESFRGRSGYESLELVLKGDQACEVVVEPDPSNRLMEKSRVVYRSVRHDPSEKVKILFFRRGPVELYEKCGETEVFRKSLLLEKPERV